MGRKIGEGSFKAALRQGHKEIAQALQALPDSNIKVVEEPGAMGTATPMDVHEQNGGYEARLERSAENGRSRPSQEREME